MENPMESIMDTPSLQFRVNAEKCATCLFNPGRMQNGMRDVIDDARRRESFVQCHETYEWSDFTPAEGVETSMCRGYWDAYREEQYGLSILDQSGYITEVPAPPVPDDTRPHVLYGSVKEGTFMVRPKEES